jgi:hypothetical protein
MDPNFYMNRANGVNGYDPRFINPNQYMNQSQTAYMNPNFVGQVGQVQQPNQAFNQFNGYGYPNATNPYMGMNNANQFQYYQYKK